jgi:hypothetical protein
MAVGKETMGTSNAVIVPANRRRVHLVVTNNSTSVTVWIGDSSSGAVGEGEPLVPGEKHIGKKDAVANTKDEFLYTGIIYGIATGSADVSFWDVDDV